MSSGLERVARAFCELNADPPDATMGGKPLWQDYLAEAGAAIMAFREPDTAMISTAAPQVAQSANDVGRSHAKHYRAMIDAAMTG